MKTFLTYALLVIAVAGIGAAVMRSSRTPGDSPAKAANATVENVGNKSVPNALPADGVVVTYFTTDVRCPSCFQIEKLSRQTVERDFSDEMQTGQVIFRSVNTDQPANQHFIDDYQLVSKTVIVSSRHGGQETNWTNLQDVWLKLGNEDEFTRYVGTEIRQQLKDVP